MRLAHAPCARLVRETPVTEYRGLANGATLLVRRECDHGNENRRIDEHHPGDRHRHVAPRVEVPAGAGLQGRARSGRDGEVDRAARLHLHRDCTVHHMEARVGGTFKMSFTNFSTGKSHSFGGKYLDLKPGELIRATDVFDDPSMPGEMITTYKFRKVSVGTEVNIVQEGIPAMIPAEMCYLGWQESLENLARLVEPNIPDQ
jgi:uncharacterized protein YndB with AHSA1/START domain